jgi:hypothetical protein
VPTGLEDRSTARCYGRPVIAFDADPDQRLDYQVMRDGGVALFFAREVLARVVSWLVQHGYRTVELDVGAWASAAEMHTDLAAALDFPDYYGRNLDALADCLGDVAECAYGLSTTDTGLALVLTGFDRFFARDARTAHGLLDVVATQSRYSALDGRRLLCLVQSDDGHLVLPPVGAITVTWNRAEWSDPTRVRQA